MMSKDSMRLALTQQLHSLVSQKFAQALTSKSLIFSLTQLAILTSKTGIPFQLRYCPALSKKPTDNKPAKETDNSSPPKRKFDPFENPSEDLLVARIPNFSDYTHNLVLNKFPVIPNHFILATRENKPQTDLLDESDLYLAYACIQAWRSDDDCHHLYAFFNSGEHSGASQVHRHLQFLPVEDMRGSTPDSNWDLLCSRMTTTLKSNQSLLYDPSLPTVHLATELNHNLSPKDLHEKYLLLLRATALILETSKPLDEVMSLLANSPPDVALTNGRPKFSYNLAMTDKSMAILPRRAEDAMIPELARSSDQTVIGTGTETGRVSINGTILAGTLMVKNQDEWEVLKAKPQLMDDLLMQIGFPIGRSKI